MNGLSPLYTEGWKLIDDGQFAEAAGRFKQALDRHPKQADALASLAIACIFLDEYPPAEELVMRAETIDPDSPIVHAAHGFLLDRDEDYAEARLHYDEAVRQDPLAWGGELVCGFVLARRAWNAWCRGQPAQALAELDALLADQPDCTYACYVKGKILFYLNRVDEALMLFTRAVQTNPASWPAYFQRGLVLENQQRYADALADFNRVLDLYPCHPACATQRDRCLAHLTSGEAA